jgi:hypothetical protein
VIFMGVLYHLRHPLLALDLIHEHVADDLMIFQSMQRGSREVEPLRDNYDFWETDLFDQPGYPKLHFVEKRYADDPTKLVGAEPRLHRGDAAKRRFQSSGTLRKRSMCAAGRGPGMGGRRYPPARQREPA